MLAAYIPYDVKVLNSGRRYDGRSPSESRAVTLEFGGAGEAEDASVLCSFGNTKVHARVTHDVVVPRPRRPNDGDLIVVLRSPTPVSPLVERTLHDAFVGSNCLDLQGLCIQSGKRVFRLTLHLDVVDDDGNCLDAASLAGFSALTRYARPAYAISDDGSVSVLPKTQAPGVKLPLSYPPLVVTVGLPHFIVDPTKREEAALKGSRACFALNEVGEVCCIEKSGGDATMTPRDVVRAMDVAREASAERFAFAAEQSSTETPA